ncbi:MAG TPA: AmmeMemoRadiSam system protein B [Prolixibacteraceae bacterium]|nr:AmmeMemoRadiSam system protein B [Prolixibacteraceae bacterium]
MQSKHFIIAVLVGLYTAKGSSQESLHNRKPYAAGRFYTDKPAELKNQLQRLFSLAIREKLENTPLALIVPHAGYIYSGEIAASAFNQIDPNRKFERIFIIGSSHTTTFSGASVFCSGNYETPFGTVEVDTDLAKQLVAENKILKDYPEAHQNEHSLEVQLPFLQYHLKNDFKIVPVIIGSSTQETARKLAAVLKPYLNEKNLFVISSDFSHYPEYNDARKADQATAEAIRTNKASKLIAALDGNERKNIPGLVTSLCGWSSVLTLLYMTEQMPDISVDLLQYKNSGDTSFGDKERVVGYYAISFTQGNAKNQASEFSLSSEDEKYLLNLARGTISTYVSKGITPEIDPSGLSANLKTPCGAFVTLYKNHILRGCIGRFDPDEPLWKVVQSMALAAATHDYRFDKVEPNELSKLTIEISVLTPLKRIKSIDEFNLGKQGIYIKKGNYTGTFLPQVATQTDWSKEEVLGHCARDKAHLGWDDWRTANLYTYEALVFGEEHE